MAVKNKKLIVVLGMHRSGTSVITRGLQVLGVNLGDTLYGALEGVNDKGFWEDIDINVLDVEMLSAINSDWYHLAAIDSIDVKTLHKQGYYHRAVELLRQKVCSASIFGFKDPRVAKLLPFWKEVFSHCQFDVSYVIAVRHPLSVAKSLAERDGIEMEHSYLLWVGHVITSLTGSAGDKRMFVDYDRLMQSPERELKRIAKTLELEVDTTALQIYKNDFLDETLRHTTYKLSDLLLDDTCPPLVYEIYAALLDVVSDRVKVNDPDFHDLIVQWSKEFDRLKSSLILADKFVIKTKSLGQAVDERDQVVVECNRQIDTLTQAVDERDQAIAERDQAIAERDGQIASLNDSIAEIRGSRSWRITAPLRFVTTTIRKVFSVIFILPYILKKGGGLQSTFHKSVNVIRKEGIAGVKIRLRRAMHQDTITEMDSVTLSKLLVVPHYIDPQLDSIAEELGTEVSVAIHLHLHYTEMLNEFASHLEAIHIPYDLYVSVPESSDLATINSELMAALPHAGEIIVEPVPNRGKDIAPLIIQFGERLSQYEIIGHFHADKSPRNSDMADWCTDILDLLIGPHGSCGGRVAHIVELLQSTAKIVFPEGRTELIKDCSGWSANYDLAKQLLEKYTQFHIHDFPVVEFPEGPMFWARAECLKDFLGLPLNYSDFPSEPMAGDGTLVHVLQRLILIFMSEYQGKYISIYKGDSIRDYRYYEEQQDYSSSIIHSDIKVLSYYLPQFHPTPENDLWHGKGFTEWTKVRAANPLFDGHYQQHIPHSDIGYYLLDSPDVLRHQAELMRQAGVHGQVFYHYWFSGKLILEEPARLLLDNPDINMPFCFCWANENWTRRWDGNESEILLGQNYSTQDAQDFIQYLIPFFKDPRYIKIDDRPVLFVYRPSSIPNSQEYLDIWETECAKVGIKLPYVVAVLTRGASNPKDFGMDAGVERNLHDWTDGAVPEKKNTLLNYQPINGSVLSYDEVANFYTEQKDVKDFTYFRSLVPIWDNTARYGSDAYVLHGSTPELFQEWLESTIAYTKSTLQPDRQFVLVNAWNEWAEGAHLEPDTRYGYSYLNSVGRALSGITYSGDLNLSCSLPAGIKVCLSFSDNILDQLQKDNELKKRFIFHLSRSSVFNVCSVSTNALELMKDLSITVQPESDDADFFMEFRQIALFDSLLIEKMIQMACESGSAVIANSYDGNSPLIEVTDNGSVHSNVRNTAPLLLSPKVSIRSGYKNFRMRTDARCFVAQPSTLEAGERPAVTTIIRFHKSANISDLKNALYCLSAMQDCIVVPLIAVQDLDEQQITMLENVLDDFSWIDGFEPQIHHYHSPNGNGDLRSKMLNESLKKVSTHYAAVLDFDDLLMSHAYSWLVGRLKKTGKAISFGRVYSTSYNGATGVCMERKKEYSYGHSYEDFIGSNHAPIHSFMLDMDMLNLDDIIYYDDHRYMEDYFLTLQLFTQDNADWTGLKEDLYIGDYIHSVDRKHTLAFNNEVERRAVLADPEYKVCENRICDMRKSLKNTDSNTGSV